MKSNIFALIGGICFATLFYDQRLGLNSLLFALFLVILLIPKFKALQNKTSFVIAAAGMIASSIAVMWHGSDISIFFYFFSCLLFIGYAAHSQVSSYIAFFNGVYTTLFGNFHNLIYNRKVEKVAKVKTYETSQILRLIFIPLGLVLLFIFMYGQINPVFNQWITAIDLSFINFLWIMMVVLGAWITSNISTSKTIEEVTEKDLDTGNQLTVPETHQIDVPKTRNELQTGSFSMIALNILLLTLLASEFIFIVNLQNFEASALSQAVHAGVYASISSIVLAIMLILIFFRGSINFVKENKNLKLLAYLWIALNFLLTLSILVKTYIYIDYYGLSIKRIGVLMYLSLCIIGLITTYFKIENKLNLYYLLRKNTAIGFTSILLFSLVNWSSIVTRYNVQNGFVHFEQLAKLLPENSATLAELGLLQEVTEYRNKAYLRKVNLDDFKNRNWQEYNHVAAQLKIENHDVSE